MILGINTQCCDGSKLKMLLRRTNFCDLVILCSLLLIIHFLRVQTGGRCVDIGVFYARLKIRFRSQRSLQDTSRDTARWKSRMRMTVKVVLTLGVVASLSLMTSAATTSMYQFDTTDATSNPNFPEGSNEYHCFDIEGGVKTYVRGSYGYYGYFEGAPDPSNPQAFLVSWWDTGSFSALTPESGSAVLTYDASFTSVTGPYWSAGTSDVLNSYGTWSAENGTLAADDTTSSGAQMILTKCLYPGASNAIAREDISALDNTAAITGTSDQGEFVFCSMPAGPSVGPWLATYTFIYGEDDGGGTEEGNHGTNPISYWGASGMGMTGLWKASTGTYAGTQGSNIYMVVADTSNTYIVGFYCNVNENNVKIACYTEYYTVTSVNENANNCPNYYRMDSSLDPLYTFAAVGSALSDDGGGSNNNKVAVAMAALFGCLTGVLLVVVGYLLATRGGSSGPMAKKADTNAQL